MYVFVENAATFAASNTRSYTTHVFPFFFFFPLLSLSLFKAFVLLT